MLTLKKTAERILAGTAPSIAIKEHVDTWNRAPSALLFQEMPPMIGIAPMDAWMAAAAEYEAFLLDMGCPDWAAQPERFLKMPYTANLGRNAIMLALIETPAAFRRRMLFIGRTEITKC